MPDRELTRANRPDLPVLGESRTRVLQALRAASGPLGVDDIADRVRLHPNTVRFHLDGLVTAGLAERTNEDRELPGRPRALYAATPESAGTGTRNYRLLAEILTSYLAGQSRQPAHAAMKAGEEWGRFLVDRPPPFARVDPAEATRRLTQTLDEIGFAPEPVTKGRRRQVLLHHCPFLETAQEHREVVCSIHLGLMRGVLSELETPLEVERLEPFVEHGLCVAHLAARKRGAASDHRR